MSKESQPPRSRRELRLQRSEAADLPQDRDGSLPAIDAGAPRAPQRPPAGEPDAAGARLAERSSQARARDREAHQALKALTEALPKVAVPEDTGKPPTRRQLRLQQLERERGAQTGGHPAAAGADAGKKDGGIPVDAGYSPQHPPLEGGRRDRRKRSAPPSNQSAATQATPELPPAAVEAVEAGEMTVEQALAARELLMGQAKNMANVLAAQQQDPRQVDLEVLAQQKALAERAAVLNRRAADKQRLSAENRVQRTTAADPDLTSAPMEFVRVPGSDKQVLRPSATSYVPVVADRPKGTGRPEKVTGPATPLPAARPKGATAVPPAPSRPGRTPAAVPKPASAPNAAPSKPAATPVGKEAAGVRNAAAPVKPAARKAAAAAPAGPAPRSRLLAHAENVADNTIQPLRATNAHGLDPLDAQTAGLGQANRMRIAVVAALALGAAAFIAGIIMMIISFSG